MCGFLLNSTYKDELVVVIPAIFLGIHSGLGLHSGGCCSGSARRHAIKSGLLKHVESLCFDDEKW